MTLFDEVETRKSYYETLEVAETAETAEIKRAYFGKVRKYQPDRFPEEFKEIRAAYETLTDPEKRAEYDAVGSLPPYAASMLHDAQWYERAGKHGKAAECYQRILKRYPELDSVREQYAQFLLASDKTGKAAEVWEELSRRHPDNDGYLRELGRIYFERGWTQKAFDTAQRALNLDRSSIENWLFFIGSTTEQARNGQDIYDYINALALEALKVVRTDKKEEWKKIDLHAQVVITANAKNIPMSRDNLREIIRLVRGGGRNGQDNGSEAFREILNIVHPAGLGDLYPEIEELAKLLPDSGDAKSLRQLHEIKIFFDIQSLTKKGFHLVFHDLLTLLSLGLMEDEDELEILAMELTIIEDSALHPQLRRLKAEFPELYAIHGAFFNEALRSRNPEKMLYQREKKFNRLKREIGPVDDDPEYETAQPVRRAEPKVGRNDPCPCGSGKKYKRCCGA
ncbi:MAG: DnaJ domain-containing protein [Spirochaetales bacterium]|nr:DnaJ domain-containing protein [Spirochaetales bacterium]